MARTQDHDHIISQGSLRKGGARVDYYTTTPAPSQWIAVGVLLFDNARERSEDTRRLIVGNGSSEHQAIADLNSGFDQTLSTYLRTSGVVPKDGSAVTDEILTDEHQVIQDESTSAYRS